VEEGSSWHQCARSLFFPVRLSKTESNMFVVLYYATRLVERYDRLVEYCEHTRDARGHMLAQLDEGLRQNQEQLFSRHGDFSRQAGHWVSTNNNLDRALTNDEHGMHHQQYNSATDDQHDSTRL
jgi:hypothetical protein